MTLSAANGGGPHERLQRADVPPMPQRALAAGRLRLRQKHAQADHLAGAGKAIEEEGTQEGEEGEMSTKTKNKRINGIKPMKVARGTARRLRRENMAAFIAERERRNRPQPEGRIA
mgnify:CR=1 FL=1